MNLKLKVALLCLGGWLSILPPAVGQGFADEANLDYVLQRYIDAMGGRAALEKMLSVRMVGTIDFSDGKTSSLVVLKKKPNRVRLTLLSGNQRMIQAYDGEQAWISQQSGSGSIYRLMPEPARTEFIREAPIANALVDRGNSEVVLELGPEVKIVNLPCFQVIARYNDDSKSVHFIGKEDFYELRIHKYDTDGNLVAELIPSRFETIEGITFAMTIKRFVDGKLVSTMNLDQVDVNLGILDNAFRLPDQADLGK